MGESEEVLTLSTLIKEAREVANNFCNSIFSLRCTFNLYSVDLWFALTTLLKAENEGGEFDVGNIEYFTEYLPTPSSGFYAEHKLTGDTVVSRFNTEYNDSQYEEKMDIAFWSVVLELIRKTEEQFRTRGEDVMQFTVGEGDW